MDTETAHNLTTNFLGYQRRYVAHQMQKVKEVSPEFLKDDAVELFVYLIDLLPLDGRSDLTKLKDKLRIDESHQLQRFIQEQRQQLAVMMGVDGIYEYEDLMTVNEKYVDLRLALGFGGHKCIQADFLLPAILAMATEVDMPITIIPDCSTRNRTRLLMHNLVYFASIYRLDEEVAETIQQKFADSLKGVAMDSPDYDLGAIAFFLNVCIENFILLSVSL